MGKYVQVRSIGMEAFAKQRDFFLFVLDNSHGSHRVPPPLLFDNVVDCLVLALVCVCVCVFPSRFVFHSFHFWGKNMFCVWSLSSSIDIYIYIL